MDHNYSYNYDYSHYPTREQYAAQPPAAQPQHPQQSAYQQSFYQQQPPGYGHPGYGHHPGHERRSHHSYEPHNYQHHTPRRQLSSPGPQNSAHSQRSYDTLSQYSATTRPHTEHYDRIETNERGLKDYFMKTSFDEYGTEQARVSKSKFAVALALGGAAMYAAKMGYERYKERQFAEQLQHEDNASVCMDEPPQQQPADYIQ
ncbi:hypothetical protein H4R23_005294 [Coemansia sp. Cherry 401B]|nr:hypothetical protein H4R23_005294 [Coemansia sp. Cherry 401B]